jgi:sn-glycerol 3-phosphate transport system ATP-binding protein
MHGGVIEQVGKPQDVYRWPASRFVATFIGSPAMNLFSGRVLTDGIVEAEGGKLSFSASLFSVEPGREVDIGIRPEDLRDAPPEDASGLAFAPEFIEELGATRLFHGLSGSTPIVVATAASAIREMRPGARLTAGPMDIHLFDRATGKTLRTGHA